MNLGSKYRMENGIITNIKTKRTLQIGQEVPDKGYGKRFFSKIIDIKFHKSWYVVLAYKILKTKVVINGTKTVSPTWVFKNIDIYKRENKKHLTKAK
jgi:hypothetical protein